MCSISAYWWQSYTFWCIVLFLIDHAVVFLQIFICFFFNMCPLFFFIGVYLLYSFALVSAVQWSESAMCIHISPPSWTSLSHPTPSPALGHPRAWSWAPCAIEQLLTSCFTNGSVFMSSVLIFQFIPPSPSSSPPTPVSTCLLCASASLFMSILMGNLEEL